MISTIAASAQLAAPPSSAWVRFLRSYGPTPNNLTLFDEFVTDNLVKAKVKPITLSSPQLEKIKERVSSGESGSILIAGTAGDGKTYHCRGLWTHLGGAEKDWTAKTMVKHLKLADGRQANRIAPTSDVPILSKYAIYCVSQANSASSRNWRMAFIKAILRGTYAGAIDDQEQRDIVSETASDIRFAIDPYFNGDGCPPAEGFVCGGCGGYDEGETSLVQSILYWPAGSTVFQLANAKWAHSKCKGDVQAAAIIDGTQIPGVIEDDQDGESDGKD